MIKGCQTQILKIYENIQKKNKEELDKRKKIIYTQIPEIKDIENKIARLSIKLSMSIINNAKDSDKYLKELRESVTNLRIRKAELLVMNDYPNNYLDMHYNCPKCKDTGFIGTERCSCYKKYLVKVYYKNSDLRDYLIQNNFKNFNLGVYSADKDAIEIKSPRKNIIDIVQNVKNYIHNFDKINTNLLFYGTSGTGKTFMSHCIAKELLDKGYFVLYRTAQDLVEDLKQDAFEDDSNLRNILLNCDLLIIDDLGTEQLTQFSISALFNLINWKILHKKKMLISTNLSIEELSGNYSERITSRLFGNFELHKFYGDDIRVKKNLNKIK